MEYIQDILTHINRGSIIAGIEVCITLLVTILLNSLFRSFIHVPKRLDTRRGRTYVAIVRSIITIMLFIVAVNIIFLILNINIAPLLASAGIVGLTIGIGARSLVEDLIAGMFLLTQDTLAIGDYVTVAGIEGTIEDIGFKSLILKGTDGSLSIIPNGQVKQVINYSRGKAIIPIDIPVKAGQKLETITTILSGIIEDLKQDTAKNYQIASDSAVFGIQNIQAGNIILIRITLVTAPSLRLEVEKEYRERAVKAFAKHKLLFA